MLYFLEVCETERFQTAKVTFKVTKGHRQWCHSIDHILFSIIDCMKVVFSCHVMSIEIHAVV